MSVLAVDLLIKTMIETSFADYRANPWLLDDVFGGLATDPLANLQYGYKEVEEAKQWFLANEVPVYLNHRIDSPRFPCVTVIQTASREMTERDALADENGELEEVDPKGRGVRAIQKVYDNFTPISYNPTDGLMKLPASLDSTLMVPGQFLVSIKSGKAYVIKKTTGDGGFYIAAGTVDDFTQCYIAPPTSLWNLHREVSFMDESFAIGLHTQSKAGTCIWLRQLMVYTLLRYKEAFLEGRGFELSTFNVGAVDENPYFSQSDKVYSCPVTLSGQVEVSWIKMRAPKLQAVKGGIYIIDGPKTPKEYEEFVKKQGWQMVGDK